MKIPITQSEAWAKLQSDLGEQAFLNARKNYQYLAILKKTPVGNYLYCPYGPAAESKDDFQDAIVALQELARQQNAIFIRIEPIDPSATSYLAELASSQHFKLVKTKDLNPKETWLLDLAGTDDDLRQKLPSRLLRYYKSAAGKGIIIKKSHDPADIHYLLDLQKALAREKGISTFSEKYLQTELSQPFATLYLVSLMGDTWTGARERSEKDVSLTRGKVIAAGLVFDDETTRYNLQGAQSDEGRKLHATGILTIQLILDAKAKGQKLFDFWGIAPEGAPANHPWAGFTNFKKTFSGYQQDHAGTYDLVLSPTKYKLYQLLRKIRRLI